MDAVLSVNTEQPFLDPCLSAAEFYSSSIRMESRCFSCLWTSNESIWLADCGNCFFCEIQQSILHGGGVFNVWVLFFFFSNLNFWEFPLGKKKISSSMSIFLSWFRTKVHIGISHGYTLEAGFLHTIQLVASLYRQPRVIMSGNCILIIWT